MKFRILKRVEWKSKSILVKGRLSGECRFNVLDGCRKFLIKSFVNGEFRKCY